MVARIGLVLLVGLTAVAEATPVAAQGRSPAQELALARDDVRASRWDECKRKLSYLLYPRPRLGRATDINEAHLLLGVCHFESQDKSAAEREFRLALVADTQLSLDPLLFSETTIQFFEVLKKDVEKQQKDDAAKASKAATIRALRRFPIKEHSKLWVNFVPFGSGQFQNGHRRKAIAFAVGEALFGGTSLLLYAWQVTRYGINGEVPDADVASVNRLQIIQISSGAVCLGLMVWGAIDALYYYQGTVTRPPTDKEIQQMLRDIEDEQSREKSSFKIIPYPAPRGDGGGLSLLWEF